MDNYCYDFLKMIYDAPDHTLSMDDPRFPFQQGYKDNQANHVMKQLRENGYIRNCRENNLYVETTMRGNVYVETKEYIDCNHRISVATLWVSAIGVVVEVIGFFVK